MHTFDELQEAYDDLAYNFECISSKYKKKHALLKNENAMLCKEKEELENKIKALELNVHELTKKNDLLNDALAKAKEEPRMHARNDESKHVDDS